MKLKREFIYNPPTCALCSIPFGAKKLKAVEFEEKGKSYLAHAICFRALKDFVSLGDGRLPKETIKEMSEEELDKVFNRLTKDASADECVYLDRFISIRRKRPGRKK